jgi:hypothetical protein
MISFQKYFLLNEGGNVFKNNPTSRINLQDIGPTVDFISSIVGINLKNNLLGSTGKRESSGDIDVAVLDSKITKEELVKRLTKWCEERNLNPKDFIAKSGINVHFRTPIYNNNEQFVQTDFMFVPDLRYAKFTLANNEQFPYKGMHRAVLLSNLAKNINMKFSGIKGITDRDTGAVIEDRNPDRVAQILLGNPSARERDLESIKNIMLNLKKRYKDNQVVLSIIDDARQTIQKDGLDIAEFLQGKTITESTTKEGNRVGVQHLYSMYKPTELSMDYENFKTLVDSLLDNAGVIEPGNSTVSEKADGMAVRFGITSEGKYFLQGSYSGIVTDGNFDGKIKHEPTKECFESNFTKIKSHIYNTLKKAVKNYDIDGIRVQAEWLYSPFALKRDDSEDIVYFVATNYEKDKLGSWSTFALIDITDFNGEQLVDDVKFSIMSDLVRLSDKDVKFLPLDIDAFSPIDLNSEANAALQEIKTFEMQNPEYGEILYSDSRKRVDQIAKKEMRQKVVSLMLPHQKRMHEKILNHLHNLAGKLGEYEGLVIKLKTPSGEPFIFKIISPHFHKNKGRQI